MLTEQEKACNFETMRHIERVRNLLSLFVVELLKRGSEHDQSKLESPEVEAFTAFTSQLAGSTYGSKAYYDCKLAMKPALDHHYANNSHHPEHHKNGVEDMTLLDVLEMLADWKAASERHNDGNILKSIEINGKRFHISSQLVRIMENTARIFDNS